jgi:hypothetical protein
MNYHSLNQKTPDFHIHVDAQQMSLELELFLIENLKFWNSNFSGHPEGALHFETPRHLTWKSKDAKEARSTFDTLINYLESNPNCIEGYVEGEYIPVDIDLPAQPFNPNIPIPYRLELCSLEPGKFREDEIHITLDREKSDPRLIAALRSMGFFSAWMEKSSSSVEIFTVQGERLHIEKIFADMITYLRNAGGAVNGSIKEEKIVRWWLSSPDLKLPPVFQNLILSP